MHSDVRSMPPRPLEPWLSVSGCRTTTCHSLGILQITRPMIAHRVDPICFVMQLPSYPTPNSSPPVRSGVWQRGSVLTPSILYGPQEVHEMLVDTVRLFMRLLMIGLTLSRPANHPRPYGTWPTA